jgi:RNA polymerase sigma-70 factor (ECF subfamily)
MDRRTVDRLVVEHLPAALRFAQRLTGDSHIAEDVVQEALCRVLRQWRGFRGESQFGTWLLGIVVNVDRDRRRRQRHVIPLPGEDVVDTTAQPPVLAAAEELSRRIRAAIGELPSRQREVTLLMLGERLSASQAAEVLGISEPNVHTCLHLARKRLAQVVGLDSVRRESP